MTLRLHRLFPLLALLLLLPQLAQGQVVLSDRSASGALTAAWNGTGTQPAATAVLVSLPSQNGIAVQLTGTFVGTVQFEALIDQARSSWLAINGTPFAGGTSVSSATATGAWIFNVAGVKVFRVRCSAYTSGTIQVGVVSAVATPPSTTTVSGTLAVSGGLTNNNAAPTTTNVGVLPGLANAAAPTFTEGDQVLLSTDLSGRLRTSNTPSGTQTVSGTVTANAGTGTFTTQGAQAAGVAITANPVVVAGQNGGNVKLWLLNSSGAGTVTGALSHNNAVPGTDFIEGLTGIANAAAPTFVEGNVVALSENLAGALRIVGTAGTATIGNVGGLTKNVDATLTRPANQTAYTANDEMTDTGGAIQTITGAAVATGGSGIITHCFLSCSSNAATKPQLTIYVYDTTSTPATDNAAFAPSDAVQDTSVGSFQLNTAEVGDATSSTGNFTMDSGQIHVPFVTSGSANLFFRVKVNNAYTAGTNSDTYKFRWQVQEDAK